MCRDYAEQKLPAPTRIGGYSIWSRAPHPSIIMRQSQNSPSSSPREDVFIRTGTGVEPAPVPIAAIAVDRPFATIPGYRSAKPHGRLQIVLLHAPDAATAVRPQGGCCNVTFGLHVSPTHYIRGSHIRSLFFSLIYYFTYKSI